MAVSNFIARRLAFSKSRSFTKVIIRIAIAAIAISLATMIIATAVIDGFKEEITQKVFGYWGHIHITDTNINRSFEQVPISKYGDYVNEIREIDWLEYQVPASILGYEVIGKYEKKRTLGGVKNIQPYAIAAGLLSTKNSFSAILLKGVDEHFDWNYIDQFIVEGESLDFNSGDDNELVVSKSTASALQLKNGQRVRVNFIQNNEQLKRAFVIKGIYNSGLDEYDKRFALAHLSKVQNILGWNEEEVTGFEVFLENPNDTEIYNEYIYNNILPVRLYNQTIQSKFPSIFEWLKLQDINETLILQLMLVVAVINMITALLILILERTHMIGVLKSLGANNWTIRKVFLWNAAYMITIGLIIGNVLGLGLCLIQDQFHLLTLNEQNYYISYAPILLTWWKVLLLNLLCLLITVTFLILPTYIVTRISPVKSLRFE